VIGFIARLFIKTDLDFFLSGRSLPAWITGLAFIAANLGALEILGQAANGAQYGIPAVHYYWIGAVPAMVFLGLVMMPFYYGSKVRSVPEYLKRRYNEPTRFINAITFAVSALLKPCLRRKASRSSSLRAMIRSRAALMPAMKRAGDDRAKLVSAGAASWAKRCAAKRADALR